jgi:hypothetical protein
MSITLSQAELEAITGYQQATKQLRVLHARGFLRAYISRKGEVVLERTHYEAVTKGEVLTKPTRTANLSIFRNAA